VKICVEMQRPIPHRADSIGPWLNNLGFLTWIGSVTSASLIYLFSHTDTPTPLTLAGILTAIVFSEHVYFIARLAVSVALSKLDSPGLIKEKQERFLIRRRYLQESMGIDEETEHTGIVGAMGVEGDDECAFWGRQEGARGAFVAGIELIKNSKKDQ